MHFSRTPAVLLLLTVTALTALASDIPPELVAGSAFKVSDTRGTTFYATWIANNPAGGVRPEFIFQKAGQAEQRVFAKPAPIKGTRKIKVSARVLGLTRTTAFEWRAFAGGGANDQDSTTVPETSVSNPQPGFPSAALPPPATFLGIIEDGSAVPKGFCKAKLTASGMLTGTFDLAGLRYRFSGSFADDGQLVVSEKLPFEATFIADAAANRIDVTVVGTLLPFGPWTMTLVPTNPLYSTQNPTPLAGRYTVLLPIDPAKRGESTVPQGESHATMVISANGNARLTTKLADGTAITLGSTLDEADGLSLSALLYGTTGYLVGKLAFSSVPDTSDAAGKFAWQKSGPAFLRRPYDNGFALELFGIASRYIEPIPASDLILYLASLDLNDVLAKVLTLRPLKPQFVSPIDADALTLNLDVKTGLLKGSFLSDLAGLSPIKRTLSAVVFQAQDRVGGYHFGESLSGLVTTIDPINSTSHAAADVPLAIPDNDPSGVTSTINVSQTGTLTKCRVTVDIEHTFRGDLVVKLVSPTGTEVLLHNRTGGGTAHVFLVEVAVPEVVGETAAGNWQLRVADEDVGIAGTLKSWSLKLTTQ